MSPPVPSQILAPELAVFVKYICTVEQLVLRTRWWSINYPGHVPMWGVVRQHFNSLDKCKGVGEIVISWCGMALLGISGSSLALVYTWCLW